jgi:hypothetical protein
MSGREERFSVFKMYLNFSDYLRLGTNYESNTMLTAIAKITTIDFVLHVVSAVFQTSRSKARH